MCFLAFNQMHIRILDAFHDFSCFLFLYTCQNHENQFAPSIHQINFRNSRCCIYMNRNASNASRCISNAWFWSLFTTSYFNLLLTGSLLYIYIYIYIVMYSMQYHSYIQNFTVPILTNHNLVN